MKYVYSVNINDLCQNKHNLYGDMTKKEASAIRAELNIQTQGRIRSHKKLILLKTTENV